MARLYFRPGEGGDGKGQASPSGGCLVIQRGRLGALSQALGNRER